MNNLSKIDNKEYQRIKFVVEKITKSNWRYYNLIDGQMQWVGGKVIESETGKSYPVKTTDELIELFLNEYN